VTVELHQPPTRAYANRVLALLLVVYVFNFLDRQLLSILIEPVKADLQVSDSVMGFLTGPAFAFFYTFGGLPVARLADLWSRRSVIAIAVGIWSAMTALTGLARNTVELALARVAVGIGEAGGTPPSHSILSDYFPPEWRARALGIFSAGVPIGTLIGYAAGGWLGQELGWRSAFFLVGLPGVLLSLAVRYYVREPRRGMFDPPDRTVGSETADLGEVFRFISTLPSFRWIVLGVGMAAFSGYGFAIWKPVFLMRVHGFGLAETGLIVGLISGITGLLSTLSAGWVADRLGRRDPRWICWLPAASIAASFPFQLVFLLHPDPWTAVAFSIPAGLVGGFWPPPTYAAVQTLVKPHMRALASAVLLFFLNLIGLGAGPWVVGFLSDLFAAEGVESIRWALLIAFSLNIVGILFYLLAARSYPHDLQR
jgi:MFS family permease